MKNITVMIPNPTLDILRGTLEAHTQRELADVSRRFKLPVRKYKADAVLQIARYLLKFQTKAHIRLTIP